MSLKICPYKMSSKGARLLKEVLQEKLGERVVLTQNPRYMRNHTIINWGYQGSIVCKGFLGNSVQVVRRCINKLLTFDYLGFDLSPKYTRFTDTARQWIREGHTVYCRTKVQSQEGRGIVIAETEEQLVPAPLYTQRFKHSREYRVHYAFGDIIQITQKKRRNGHDDDGRMRSNNNWVFARQLDKDTESEEIQKVIRTVLDGAANLGIHFGGFDVLYSAKQRKAIILECNTAPGLDRTSANLYADAFISELNTHEV